MQSKFLAYIFSTLLLLSSLTGCADTTDEGEVAVDREQIADPKEDKSVEPKEDEVDEVIDPKEDEVDEVIDPKEDNSTTPITPVVEKDTISPVINNESDIDVNEKERFVLNFLTDDAGSVLSIEGEDSTYFDLNSSVVSFKTAPIYAVKQYYNITLVALDASNNRAFKDINITIIDNLAPVINNNMNIRVDEKEQFVLKFSTDDSGADLSIEGEDSAYFNLDNSILSLKNPPIYIVKHQYNIRLVAIDNANNRAFKDINISIIDTLAPVIDSNVYIDVNENEHFVLNFLTDDAEAVLSIEGEDGTYFDLNNSVLKFNAPPIYATKEQYNITLVAIDTANNRAFKDINISILDALSQELNVELLSATALGDINQSLSEEVLSTTSNMLKRYQVQNLPLKFSDVLFTLSQAVQKGEKETIPIDSKALVSTLLTGDVKTRFESKSEREREVLIVSSIIDNIALSDVDNNLTLFRVALIISLDHDEIAKEILQMGIDSETIADTLANSFSDDKGWEIFSLKTLSMMRDESNLAFSEKFMELCLKHESMADLLFTYIDVDMYDALAIAMVNSSDAHILVDSDTLPYSSVHKNEYTTEAMMNLMVDYAAKYLIVPESIDTKQGENARFSSLFFNTGSTDTEDANEVYNAKFLYAIFKTPHGSKLFIEALSAMRIVNQTIYLNLLFLGINPVPDAQESIDIVQGWFNIVVMSDAMKKGVVDYGEDSYLETFTGFSEVIVPAFKDTYTKAVVDAGFSADLKHSALTSILENVE